MDTSKLVLKKFLNLPDVRHPEYKSVLNLVLKEVLTNLIVEQKNLAQRVADIEKKLK